MQTIISNQRDRLPIENDFIAMAESKGVTRITIEIGRRYGELAYTFSIYHPITSFSIDISKDAVKFGSNEIGPDNMNIWINLMMTAQQIQFNISQFSTETLEEIYQLEMNDLKANS